MRNSYLVKYKKSGIAIISGLLILIAVLAFLSDANRNRTNVSAFVSYTVQHHTWIMLALIIVSVAFGFFWSQALYKEIESKKKASRTIMDVVLRFLGTDEKKIITHLVEHNGRTTQAELSRLPHMNKVKAYRAVQKMKKKDLINIISHGKVRKIELSSSIFEILSESG